MTYNDIQLSFKYLVDDLSHFHAESPKFSIDSDILFGSDNTLMTINYLNAYEQNSSLSGDVVFDPAEIALYIQTEAMVANSAELSVHAIVNTQAVTIKIEGISPIKKLGPIVELFHLHEKVTPWIVDYSDGSHLTLHTIKARYEYDHPERLLESIYASFDYHDFVYTFQPGLEPIRTGYTNFIFEDGVLNIFPRHASYCSQDTGASWLNIDFNPDDEPILTAYLRSGFILNDDILFLLDYFNISLPFKQLKGSTDADLTLKVPLLSVNVEARGRFHVDKGLFLYKGTELNISDSAIKIHNSNVDVSRFHAAYKETLQASANGFLNFSTGRTNLHFKATKVSLNRDDLFIDLNRAEQDLLIEYKLSSQGETLSFSPSQWHINNITVEIGAFTAPFDFKNFSATIPSTELNVKEILHTYVSGELDLTNQQYIFNLDLDKFSYKNIKLSQDKLKISLNQHTKMDISTDSKSHWLIDQTPPEIEPFQLAVNDNSFSLMKGSFFLDDVLYADVNGSYDFQKKEGSLFLNNTAFENEKIGSLFRTDKRIHIAIKEENNTTHFNVEKLNMYFKIKESGWLLNFYSLEPLFQHSKLLQDFNLSKGTFSVESKTGSYPFIFKGHVDYPYAFLLENTLPVHRYNITGLYDENRSIFQVNNALDFTFEDSVRITSKNIGFNLPEIVRYMNKHSSEPNQNSQHLPLYFNAVNTYLALGSDRRALADTLSIQYEDRHLKARLHHHVGSAKLEVEKNIFQLDGKGFGEVFVSNLFKSSQFKGGNFSFLAGGELSNFDGVIKFEDTTIRNYILLNNLLAFINTIPALVTFSIPQYSKSGFRVNEAYADLSYKDKVVSIRAIKVDGKEMDIFGNGILDYNTDQINMELSVKTQAGSNFGKIPLIGYILVGDDETAMTSFTLSGDLNDPKVKNKMAKDIVVAPFNIIKRTLELPFKILLPNVNKKDTNENYDDTGLKILHQHLNQE